MFSVSPDQYQVDEVYEDDLGRVCGSYKEEEKLQRSLVGKLEGRGPFGRHIRRWKNNIKMTVKDVGWGQVNCMNVAQEICKWQTPLKIVMNNEFHKMR